MKAGFVSLIGRPNAGKSTLLNRLVGAKLAIVSDKPQTTRTRILGIRNYLNRGSAPDSGSVARGDPAHPCDPREFRPEPWDGLAPLRSVPPHRAKTARRGPRLAGAPGAPRIHAMAGNSTRTLARPRTAIRRSQQEQASRQAPYSGPDAQAVFIDTPGIHRPLHRMNVRMVDAAVESMSQADVIGLVIDSHAAAGKGDRFVIDLLGRVDAPVILVLNKIDLIAKPSLLPLIDSYRRLHEFADIVPVSALTGDNVDRLERALIDRLPEGEPLYPTEALTDQPERFFAAEMVREQVLAHTREELPFTTAVVVDQFEETAAKKGEERGLLRMYCSILVERASQKPIVIGRRGEGIKQVGTAARLELERFFGARVYLDLRVKVKQGWREDERTLDGMGIR